MALVEASVSCIARLPRSYIALLICSLEIPPGGATRIC